MALGSKQQDLLDELVNEFLLRSDKNVCFLEGFPGTGKTNFSNTIGARAIENGYSYVLFTATDDHVSLDDFYLELDEKLASEGYMELGKAIMSNLQPHTAIRKTLKNNKLLLVVDEFQRAQDSNGQPDVGLKKLIETISLEPTLGKVILITNLRTKGDKWNEQALVKTFAPFTDEEGMAFFEEVCRQKNVTLEVPSERKSDIVNSVLKNNPRAINLFVQRLTWSTLDELVQEYDEILNGEHDISPAMLEEFERQIIKQSYVRLDGNEQRILENLSVIRKPFRKEAIENMVSSEATKYRERFNSMFFLEMQPGHWFSLHPLVREICRAKLERDDKRFKRSHKVAAQYYTRHFKGTDFNAARLGGQFVEAKFHLIKAHEDAELHRVTNIFGDIVRASYSAVTPVPNDVNILNERIALLRAYLDGQSNPGISYHMARCLKKRGGKADLIDAIKYCRLSLGSRAGHDNWLLLIRLEEQVNGLRRAIAVGKEGIKVVPPERNLFALYQFCGELMTRDGDVKGAIALLKKGVKVVPPERSLSSLYQFCGELMALDGDIKGATIILIQGIEAIPDKYNRHRLIESLGFIYYGQKQVGTLVSFTAQQDHVSQRVLFSILYQYLIENWEAGIEEAQNFLATGNSYMPIKGQLIFGLLCVGRHKIALEILEREEFDEDYSILTQWLAGTVYVFNGLQSQAKAKYLQLTDIEIGEGLDVTVEDFVVYWWRMHKEPGNPPAKYYPFLPVEITGFYKKLWINDPNIEQDIKDYLNGKPNDVPEKEPEVNSVPSNEKNILCIATEWFSKKGGLSTFNRMLSIALVKCGYKVVCYLPSYSHEELIHAQENGVTLLKATLTAGLDEMASLTNKPIFAEVFEPGIIIGHDRFTGPQAERLRSNFYPNAKTILFIHTAPGEIEWFKPDSTMQKTEERERIQKDLAKNADLVVAVGPRLKHEVASLLAGLEKQPPLFQFNPGLYGPVENVDVNISKSTIPEALMMGRIEDFELKGVDLALTAMDAVLSQWDVIDATSKLNLKPRLIIRGVEQGKDSEMRESIKNFIGTSPLNTLRREYNADMEGLKEEIRRSWIVLMPSKSEGFGLVAIEAMSEGRPFLVSEKSGFAMLIQQIAPEEYHHWVLPVDGKHDVAAIWANAISNIFKDRKAAGDRLKVLAEIYAANVTWEQSARQMLEMLNEQVASS